MTILIITHQIDVIARLADDVAVLSEGKLVESGPVADVFADPKHELTRKFVDTVIPPELDPTAREALSRALVKNYPANPVNSYPAARNEV